MNFEEMTLDELKKYSEDLEKQTKDVKAAIRQKIKENPSISIFGRFMKDSKELYVYTTFHEKGKSKQTYIGPYGNEKTFEKIKELAKEKPELLEQYEKLKEKRKGE